ATLIAENVAKVDGAIAQGLHANPRTWYKTLRGAASEIKEPFEKTAGKWMQKDGRALIGIGDDGVREVLGIPYSSPIEDAARAPDFLSVTKGNKLALSEVKGGKAPDVATALKQLGNGMKALKKKGLAGDVERVELIIEKGAVIKVNDLSVVNGYLVKVSEGNARVQIDGFKNFVMVITQ
ncbi:MAG: hypothetical protein ABI134_01455, partial [Byssovorax sp.]